MGLSNNSRRAIPGPNHLAVKRACLAFHQNEDGKITLVLPIAMLIMVLLLAFLGNAGQTVVQKIETQNAADGMAIAPATWLARAMNSVTAGNHLMGEETAVVVILESFGGPELDHGVEFNPVESRTLDGIIRGLKDLAPIRGGYGASALTSADQKFLRTIVDYVAPDNQQKAKHKAFAAIYDARMTLKRDLAARLMTKSFANLGFLVPPPFGYATAIAAFGVHAYTQVQIVKIVFEWVKLDVLEFAVDKSKRLKTDLLEKNFIPKLAEHSQVISGNKPSGSRGGNSGGGAVRRALQVGLVNLAIEDTQRHLEEAYNVKALLYPLTRTLKLPIEPEPAPSLRPDAKPKEWGSDDPLTSQGEDDLSDLMEDIEDNKSEVKQRIIAEKREMLILEELQKYVDERLKNENVERDERRDLNDEKTEIEQAKQDKQKRIEKFEKELAKMNRDQQQLQQAVNSLGTLPKVSGNLTISAMPTQMNYTEERYSQWVRSTYPYVDAFRAPLLSLFDEHLPKSKMAEHYTKWSNRLTLVKAWQFRSGYRLKYQKGQVPKATWSRSRNVKPLAMYVMKDSYVKQGKRRDRKGHELWTRATKAGREEAEKQFTILAMAHRPYKPVFSPKVYKDGPEGIATFAQAIFYNANEQTPAAIGAKEKNQAKLGWDTLNWDPEFDTPEWGSDPQRTAAKWPWEILKEVRSLDSIKVKLNWQAKLMPVTKTRLRPAALANGALGEGKREIGAAAALFDGLVSH